MDAFDEPEPRVYTRADRDPNRPTADTVRDLIGWGAPEAEIRQTYHEIPRRQRFIVVDELTDHGKTARQIADLLDVTARTVGRHRATARAATAAAMPRQEHTDRDHRTADAVSEACELAEAAATDAADEHAAGADDIAVAC